MALRVSIQDLEKHNISFSTIARFSEYHCYPAHDEKLDLVEMTFDIGKGLPAHDFIAIMFAFACDADAQYHISQELQTSQPLTSTIHDLLNKDRLWEK